MLDAERPSDLVSWDTQMVTDGTRLAAKCPARAGASRSVRHLVYSISMVSKTERLNLRLTQAQDTVLRAAADAHGETASEYVLRNAVEAAQTDLADRRVFVVDEPAWNELQAALSAPVSVPLPMLQLLSNPSVLES